MSIEKKYEESTILAMLSQDSEYAFQLLFDRYRDRIYRAAMTYLRSPILAEEVVQDVFLKVWFHRKKIRKLRSFETWLFAISSNHTLNYVAIHLAPEERNQWQSDIGREDADLPAQRVQEIVHRILSAEKHTTHILSSDQRKARLIPWISAAALSALLIFISFVFYALHTPKKMQRSNKLTVIADKDARTKITMGQSREGITGNEK